MRNKENKKLLTSTVSSRRSRNFACSRKSGGLGDIQDDTELSTALEGLAEALRLSLEHRLEARAAVTLRLGCGAAIGHKGQAISHGQNQA